MPDVTTTTYTTNYSDTMVPDVLDMITNISPTDTPLTSAIGKTSASNTLHEWPTDALKAAGANAQVEGADISADEIVPPVMANNHVQILTASFKISDTAERVKKYGRASEIKYQTAKKLKEIALDIEYAAVNNTTAAAGNATTARQMKGLEGWIVTNDDVFAAQATTNLLTEEVFNDGMQGAWLQGGSLDLVLCTPKNKRDISAFDGYNTLTKDINADAKKVVATVDFYAGDFGDVAIKAHRFIAQQTVTTVKYASLFILDTDLWKMSMLGEIKTEELAKTGLARKYLVSCEATLEARQEKGNARIKSLWQSGV
jgi:hypothetical protein